MCPSLQFRACEKVTYNHSVFYIYIHKMSDYGIIYKISEEVLAMVKLKQSLKKHACSATAFLLTGILTGVATLGCYFVYYQPQVPENLKDFSKNK